VGRHGRLDLDLLTASGNKTVEGRSVDWPFSMPGTWSGPTPGIEFFANVGMNPPSRDVSSWNQENLVKFQLEGRLSKLKISIGPVELYAHLLDTPAAEAIVAALPFSSEARVSNSIISFAAPGARQLDKCRSGRRRAGDFVLSPKDSDCGIDISKLPFVHHQDYTPEPSGDVWASSLGDIGALKHVIDGDPVAVETID